jgi:predicted negative regulator of RcsB-dependent stress response
VDIHLHEDEELEKLKEWGKNYGVALILGAVIGLGGLFGYRYWTHHLEQRAAAASTLYDEVIYNLNQGKPDQAAKLGGKVLQDYKSTPYAALTALLLAKSSYDKGDLASAQRQLQWAMDHARQKAVGHVARLRLAHLLIAEGKIDGALKLVESVKDTGGYTSSYDELRGDLFRAKGDMDKARSAYTKALSEDSGGKYSEVLRMKLADLGPAPAPSATAAQPAKVSP